MGCWSYGVISCFFLGAQGWQKAKKSLAIARDLIKAQQSLGK